jgi:hypothetical protein
MSELEPLPDELKRLFDAERAAPAAHEAARTGIRAKLAVTVGKATLGHAALGTGLGVTGKTIVAIAVAVGVAGGGTIALVKRHREPAKPRATPLLVAPAVASAPAESIAPPPSKPAPTAESAPTPPAAPAIARAPIPPTPRPMQPLAPIPTPPPAELALLREAWAALSAQDFARALELVQQDERTDPSGPLAEERDALRVLALAKLHRLDDARAAASAFETRYPTSVHRALVERAVRGEGVP